MRRLRRSPVARALPGLLAPLLLSLASAPALAAAGAGAVLPPRVEGELRLSGKVAVAGDVTVLAGGTLVLDPGTELLFAPSDSTKVDPEAHFGGAELVVRGRLVSSGAAFRFPGRTGGIVADGGSVELRGGVVEGAEAGVTVVRGGSVTVTDPLSVRDCRTGVALFPGAAWGGGGKVLAERNGVGAVRFPGAPPLPSTLESRGNEEADRLEWPGEGAGAPPPPLPLPPRGTRRTGDLFVERDEAIEGDLVVDGVIRVAPGATLSLRPGARLFFTFRDTDGDGVGENGLFLQGNLSARGTAEAPVGFYPADGAAGYRWDSVNFMASEGDGNVVEHAVVAGAYRGLHGHFSRLAVRHVRVVACLRGGQFQESSVLLSDVSFEGCGSALRCRDSDVEAEGVAVRSSLSGMNFFRSAVKIRGGDFDRPGWYALRFRECRAAVDGGRSRKGYVALSVQGGEARIEAFRAEGSGLSGFSLQEGDVTMVGAVSIGSLLDALSAERARAVLEGGALSAYGRHAVRLTGPAEVVLRKVDAGKGKAPFLDGKSSPGLGVVRVE